MKEYIIWLQGGNCIKGRISEEEAGKLLAYYNKTFKKPLYTFTDKDGIVVVDMKKVLAIGFNDKADRW